MLTKVLAACGISVALAFSFMLGSAAVFPPRASASPVAGLGALADQLSDTIEVAQRGGRSFGGGGRSFSGGGRSFGGGGRSFSGARSSGRTFSSGRTTGRTFSSGRTTGRSFSSGRTTGRTVHGGRTTTRTVHGGSTTGRTVHGGSTTRTGLTSRTGLSTRGGLTKGPGSIGRGPGHGPTSLTSRTLGHGPGSIGRGPGHGPGFASIHNRQVHVFRDRRWTWWRGSWRVWAPITALAGLYVGSDYLWPDGYVALAQPACSGVTENGCTLRWQSVPFEGGDGDVQCVQYCPRVGVVPPIPPSAMAAVGPVPAVTPGPAAGSCDLTIFSEPNFAGVSAPSSENQPRLVDVGWKNEIASLQIKGGTWDFFSDDEFNGEAMRLSPGPYDNLGDKWTKRIGSFMCIQ
jgi:hypothetical protein